MTGNKTRGKIKMSLEKAEKYLAEKGFLDHVIELAASTATVTEAAAALQVEPGMIAKTMCIQDRIGNLVAHLIRMSFSY